MSNTNPENVLTLTGMLHTTLIAQGANLIVRERRKESIIPIASIQSIELSVPKRFSNGSIVINTAKQSTGFMRLTNSFSVGLGSEIRVVFTPSHLDEARAIHEYVLNYNNKSSETATQPVPSSPVEEIRKYKALFDDGIITEEEFITKKNQLLGL